MKSLQTASQPSFATIYTKIQTISVFTSCLFRWRLPRNLFVISTHKGDILWYNGSFMLKAWSTPFFDRLQIANFRYIGTINREFGDSNYINFEIFNSEVYNIVPATHRPRKISFLVGFDCFLRGKKWPIMSKIDKNAILRCLYGPATFSEKSRSTFMG